MLVVGFSTRLRGTFANKRWTSSSITAVNWNSMCRGGDVSPVSGACTDVELRESWISVHLHLKESTKGGGQIKLSWFDGNTWVALVFRRVFSTLKTDLTSLSSSLAVNCLDFAALIMLATKRLWSRNICVCTSKPDLWYILLYLHRCLLAIWISSMYHCLQFCFSHYAVVHAQPVFCSQCCCTHPPDQQLY